MRLQKIIIYVFVIIWIMMISCKDPVIVARVGNYTIDSDDLRELIEYRQQSQRSLENYSDILQTVDELVENKLKLIGGYQAGIDQDSVVQERLSDFINKQVYSEVLDKYIFRKIIKTSMLRKKYRLQSEEWHVRHIFFPFSSQAKENEISRNQLEELRSRLLRGESFERLARRFSRDSLSAGKGGDLGFVKAGDRNWGDAFYHEVSQLVPTLISRVIKSEKGIHVVRVENSRKIDQQPFSEERESIQQSFYRSKRSALDSTYFALNDRLKAKYQPVYNYDIIDSLIRVVGELFEVKIVPQRNPIEFLDALSEEQRRWSIVNYIGGEYTIEEMYTTYNNISPFRRPQLRDTTAITEFLGHNVPRVLITQFGFDKGLHKTPRMKQKIKAEKERLIAQRARRVLVDNKVDITEEEIEQYYQENLDEYRDGTTVEVREIRIAHPDTADMIYEKLTNGYDFDLAQQQYHIDDENNGGYLGVITRSDYGLLGRNAVTMEIGEISEPIQNGGRYSIVKVLDRNLGIPKPLEEVRIRILRILRLERRDELMEAWLSKLRQNNGVVVYEPNIKQKFGFADEN